MSGFGAVSLFSNCKNARRPVINLLISSYLVLPVQNLLPIAAPVKTPATKPQSMSSHSVFE